MAELLDHDRCSRHHPAHRRQHLPDQLYGRQAAFLGRISCFDGGRPGAVIDDGTGLGVPVTTGVGRRVLFGPTFPPVGACCTSTMLLPMIGAIAKGTGPFQGSVVMLVIILFSGLV